MLGALLLVIGCGETPAPLSLRDARVAAGAAALAGAESCSQCHAKIAASFAEHGMSQSLGALDHLPAGGLSQPVEGSSYEFVSAGGAVAARATTSAGGVRMQGVVGRLGAGVFDTSYVGTELTPEGNATDRLAFLPLETLTGHGLAFSPFELLQPGTGFDMPVTAECLRCHTTQAVAALPGAAADPESSKVWPSDLLGADAFDHLQPLSCDACHGDGTRHAELKQASLASGEPSPELGLQRLAVLPPARQRDICARCHLQGEGHLELAELPRGGPQPADFLLRRPVLVPADPGDDYRFVSQVQRLALSACFESSPAMTCTSCHDPHRAARAQPVAEFDARCMSCHVEQPCTQPPELSVRAVTGRAARSDAGCVDCHVRRSQPFDLPHVTTADHFVRREIPLPSMPQMRAWEDRSGALEVFDDGRFAARLASPQGRKWSAGLRAMALLRMERVDEAQALFAEATATTEATEPPSATPHAADATLPAPTDAALPALDLSAEFQHTRGLAFELEGDGAAARAAYTRALTLDSGHPAARMNRASLRFESGDLAGALADTEELLRRYPRAEKPWNLRARVAASTGDLDAAARALGESAARWPSDAAVWHELGRVLLELDQRVEARVALERARRLEPARTGLADDLARSMR